MVDRAAWPKVGMIRLRMTDRSFSRVEAARLTRLC
jgi:hypothetical protein